MRRFALLPAAFLFSAIQLVAAEYGSLTRVTVAGTVYTPVTPPVTTTASGITTYSERTTTKTIANADILRALVARSIIPSTSGYQLGLLKTAALDGAGEFIAYKPAGPASAARRVPADLLTVNIDTGPREGTIRRNAAEALIAINLTSRDYANLSLLDFEGTGIVTQRFTNNAKLKTPQNQVILPAASGTFPGVNAPDSGNNGLGTLTVTFADAKVVDLALYGDVAPQTRPTTPPPAPWFSIMCHRLRLIHVHH